MPNESDGTESNNNLAKRIDKLPDEINSLKDICQKAIQSIKKNLVITIVILVVLTITLVILALSPYLSSYSIGYALRSNYEM